MTHSELRDVKHLTGSQTEATPATMRSVSKVPDWRAFMRNKEPRDISFGDCAELFLATELMNRGSRREFRSRLRRETKKKPGGAIWTAWHDMLCRDITPLHVAAWVEAMLAAGRAGNTVRTLVSLLSVVMNYAVSIGGADRNPCRDLPPGTLPPKTARDPDRRRMEVLDLKEVRALLGCPRVPSERMGPWVALLTTGMRWGELAGLQWRDFNLQRGPLPELAIRRTYDCRDREFRLPKGGRPRRVPVHPLMNRALGWAHGAYRRARLSPGPRDLVWPLDPMTQQPLHNDRMREAWREDLREAGIAEPVAGPRSLHCTRHTFASRLYNAGASWRMVQSMTHSLGSMKQEGCELPTYAHATWAETCDAILRLPFGEADCARVA